MGRDTITAIDVGSHKIVGATAEVEDGVVKELVGLVEVPSRGVNKGEIVDLPRFSASLVHLRAEMEEHGIRISPATFVNISTPQLLYRIGRGELRVENKEITSEYVRDVLDNAKPLDPPKGQVLIGVIPSYFLIDDVQRVVNPIGMTARRSLEVEAFMFFVPETLLINYVKALAEAGFNVEEDSIYPTPLASAVATLQPEEKENGTMMMDIGHSLTNVMFYFQGTPVFAISFKVGGYHITYDLLTSLKTSYSEAEKIKRNLITVNLEEISEEDVITYQPQYISSPATVRLKNLVEDVVVPRLERFVLTPLRRYINKVFEGKFPPLNTIVLTGGSALLKGIDALVYKYFDVPARIGRPSDSWIPEDYRLPQYSTLVGLLKLGAVKIAGEIIEVPEIRIASFKRRRGFLALLQRLIRDIF